MVCICVALMYTCRVCVLGVGFLFWISLLRLPLFVVTRVVIADLGLVCYFWLTCGFGLLVDAVHFVGLVFLGFSFMWLAGSLFSLFHCTL